MAPTDMARLPTSLSYSTQMRRYITSQVIVTHCRSVYHLAMERRSALKSLLTTFTGGTIALAAKPSVRGVLRPTTMIDTRDRTRIHFREWGAGRPIVFVAPWALCSDWWDIPITMLSERGWRCVAFDRRGHGRSDDPCRGYDFDTLADDLAAVLEGIDLQNVVLVGHSMGGRRWFDI